MYFFNTKFPSNETFQNLAGGLKGLTGIASYAFAMQKKVLKCYYKSNSNLFYSILDDNARKWVEGPSSMIHKILYIGELENSYKILYFQLNEVHIKSKRLQETANSANDEVEKITVHTH